MISKVITGKSFRGCCRYVCHDQSRSIVLETAGVRGYDYRLMAEDFKAQQALRPGKEKAVFHGILSFYPGEILDDAKMVEIAKAYLEKCGIRDTQYVITKHTDKKHSHLHIIANLVNNKGKSISDSWLGARARKISQELTIQYELKQALSKDLKLTNLEALSEYETVKYKIYHRILDTLPQCCNLDQLAEQLQKQSIDILYKYKGKSQEIQGISFRMGEYSYKGSQVDRHFSFGNLNKILSQQAEQSQNLQHEQNISGVSKKLTQSRSLKLPGHATQLNRDINNAMRLLLKPENVNDETPYELTQKAKRKRYRHMHR
jgi:hypothetical protein